MGEAGLVVGVDNGTGDGFVVGIGDFGDGCWDGSEEGVVTTSDEGVGKGTITGEEAGFVDGDTTGEDGVFDGEEDGAGDGLVGTDEGPKDGMLLGDGVGSKSQTSIRQSRPTSVLRASKISQNSSTKMASSFPV